jgi:hypothetical protein
MDLPAMDAADDPPMPSCAEMAAEIMELPEPRRTEILDFLRAANQLRASSEATQLGATSEATHLGAASEALQLRAASEATQVTDVPAHGTQPPLTAPSPAPGDPQWPPTADAAAGPLKHEPSLAAAAVIAAAQTMFHTEHHVLYEAIQWLRFAQLDQGDMLASIIDEAIEVQEEAWDP